MVYAQTESFDQFVEFVDELPRQVGVPVFKAETTSTDHLVEFDTPPGTNDLE